MLYDEMITLAARSKEYDGQKEDWTVPTRSIKYEAPEIEFQLDMLEGTINRQCRLTDWAYSQMMARLGKYAWGRSRSLPIDYHRVLPPYLSSQIINHYLQAAREIWLVRNHGQSCRAILSDRYGAVQNSDVLGFMVQIFEQDQTINGKLNRSSSVGPDSIHVKAIIQDVSGTNYGMGVYVSNNEIGGGSLKALPYIQRHSCENSIIYKYDSGVEYRHYGDMRMKVFSLRASMLEAFQASAQVMERIMEAEQEALPKFGDIVLGMAQKFNWSEKFRDEVLIGTENNRTRMGLVNGISWAAKSVENEDDRAAIEMLAGDTLFGNLRQYEVVAR